jgi:hypothetical protein
MGISSWWISGLQRGLEAVRPEIRRTTGGY